MADFKSPENLKRLLDALEATKESDMLTDKIDDLTSKSNVSSNKILADRLGTLGDASETISEGKPNFTMRDLAEDMLPVKQSNLPDVTGEVVDRSDEVSRALVKSGSKVPSTLSTVGKVASRAAGPLLGVAGAVLGEDQVQAATFSPEETELPFDERRAAFINRMGGEKRTDSEMSKVLDAAMRGLDTQDALVSQSAGVPFRPMGGDSEQTPTMAKDVTREPKRSPATQESTTRETSKKTTTEPESIVDKYEKMLKDYENSKKDAKKNSRYDKAFEQLMNAFAQADLAGGAQFAGLKPKTMELEDLGYEKDVENKFNKQLQLEGLRRKEKEMELKKLEPSWEQKEQFKYDLKNKSNLKKIESKDVEKAQTAMTQLEEQEEKIKKAMLELTKASKNVFAGDTGPIIGRLPTLTEQGQRVDQALNTLSLDKMVKMFAGMSKAIDSDAERAFFQSAQASDTKDIPVNLEILQGMLDNIQKLKDKTSRVVSGDQQYYAKSQEGDNNQTRSAEFVRLKDPKTGAVRNIRADKAQKYIDKGAIKVD